MIIVFIRCGIVWVKGFILWFFCSIDWSGYEKSFFSSFLMGLWLWNDCLGRLGEHTTAMV